jgi:mono/diheme cytochrome c family protein
MKCRKIGSSTGALILYLLFASAASPADEPRMLNPFAGDPDAIQEGRRLYANQGCSACHGLMGGGGMGKAILDDTWVFGSDDGTLFKLMKGQIPQQTMPKNTLPDEQIWKMLAFVRSLYKGDPALINWPLAPPKGVEKPSTPNR